MTIFALNIHLQIVKYINIITFEKNAFYTDSKNLNDAMIGPHVNGVFKI